MEHQFLVFLESLGSALYYHYIDIMIDQTTASEVELLGIHINLHHDMALLISSNNQYACLLWAANQLVP